jgi:hypothetical protein
VDSAIVVVVYLLIGAAICVGVICSLRLVRAMFTAAHALEQIGRTMEDIASTLKKDRI